MGHDRGLPRLCLWLRAWPDTSEVDKSLAAHGPYAHCRSTRCRSKLHFENWPYFSCPEILALAPATVHGLTLFPSVVMKPISQLYARLCPKLPSTARENPPKLRHQAWQDTPHAVKAPERTAEHRAPRCPCNLLHCELVLTDCAGRLGCMWGISWPQQVLELPESPESPADSLCLHSKDL